MATLGGLTTAVHSKVQNNAFVRYSDGNVMLSHLPGLKLSFTVAYYPSKNNIEDLLTSISFVLKKVGKLGKTFILGDFNCRLDINSTRTNTLLEFRGNDGFYCLSEPKEYTFVSAQGSSTID